MKKNTNKSKKKHENNNRVIFSVIFIILTIFIIAGVSYAAFNYLKPGEQKNQIKTGTLIVTLDDETATGISIEGAMPTSDIVGKTLSPYKFTIENEGTINSNYRIKIVDDSDAIQNDGCESKLLEYDQVKYALVKNGVEQEPLYLNADENGIIDFGTIAPNGKNTYELRLWIDSEITNPVDINGKHLHIKIRVDAIQDKYTDFDDIN